MDDVTEIIAPIKLSNSAVYGISYTVYICPHSLSVGYKTKFAFAQLPDVDGSEGTAACSTISQVQF